MKMKGAYYLAVIAIDSYAEQTPLKAPVNDAERIAEVLCTEYGVRGENISRLYNDNATNRNIMKLLRSFQELSVKDTLIIYYAGHGMTDEFDRMNFWLPYDAGADSEDRLRWLPSQTVVGAMRRSGARHVLLLNDSCFSGDFIGVTRDVREKRAGYRDIAQKYLAREVITSGMGEVVADSSFDGHSPFAWHLLDGLKNHSEECIDADELYEYVKRGVKGQRPLHRVLPEAGHQDGGLVVLYRGGISLGEAEVRTLLNADSSPAHQEKQITEDTIEKYLNMENGFIEAVRNNESETVLAALINSGLNINETEEHHMSAIWFTLFETKNMELFTFLLNHGADINLRARIKEDGDLSNISLLGYVLERKYSQYIPLVLENGADPNSGILIGNAETKPLMIAAQKANKEVVGVLIDYGAEVNDRDSDGDTALDYALAEGNSDIADYIQSRGGKKGADFKGIQGFFNAINDIFGPE